MNENSDYIYTNYANNDQALSAENEKLKLIITHKEELLKQKRKRNSAVRRNYPIVEKGIK
ncbi:hypothetical protein [Avibacterium paragallinarum]|uniref:hypothetical protein n=1 Tax=Avibacterium paragallinarum TaxID=728 RepID=UPI001FD71C76|nr:hypothetical protein [Avibacterium paragallinarum]